MSTQISKVSSSCLTLSIISVESGSISPPKHAKLFGCVSSNLYVDVSSNRILGDAAQDRIYMLALDQKYKGG